jgi:cytochrome c oxidase assembly factor CtaG
MAPLGWLAIALWVAGIFQLVRNVRGGFTRAQARHVVLLISAAILWWSTSSSFARASMNSLPRHMLVHILVMFVVPLGLVTSGLSGDLRRMRGASTAPRGGWNETIGPLLACVTLNAVMVISHLPTVFNWAMRSMTIYHWVVEPAFLFSGWWFFTFIVNAPGRDVISRLRIQLLMLVVTMAEMFILAMSMSIFTKSSWYAMGMGMRAEVGRIAFHDQQLGAAILWVCGDFWAVPLVVLVIRRVAARDGSVLGAVERYARESFVGS